jgi:hypothetical protein
MHDEGLAVTSRNRRGADGDRGSVLPLVLVMIVVSGLIVVPLMDYAISVFRANNVVSQRTKQLEAAKGGLRVALADPRNVFLECDGGGSLPSTVVNGVGVSTDCVELGEVGPNEALGFEVPTGATTMQLGASVPQSFSGTKRQSDAAPPFTDGQEHWWDGQASDVATDGLTWLPNLPQFPSTARTGGFAMPSAFACTVYFPGRYTSPLSLSSGRHYFTSGVYYFSEQVSITGTADVIAGYGLSEFDGSDCADDVQVAANVQGDPGTFDINGGGATWVFGQNGRLVIRDSSGSGPGPRVRFNQRYADPDRGGRISIMTVNGASTSTPHSSNQVSRVPFSQVLTKQVDGSGGVSYVPQPIVAGSYTQSYSYDPALNSTDAPLGLTDASHTPLAPSGMSVQWLRMPTGSAGAARITWNAVTGQRLGGALLDADQDSDEPYVVTVRRSGSSFGCTRSQVVTSGSTLSCVVTGLATSGSNYTASVSARNTLGEGAAATATGRPTSSSPRIAATAPPTSVTAVNSDQANVAKVRWFAPTAANTAPITGYNVTAYRVSTVATTPPALPAIQQTSVGTCSVSTQSIHPVALECLVPDLLPLTVGNGLTPGDLGYRFEVTATSATGTSTAGASAALPTSLPYPGGMPSSFAPTGTGLTPPPAASSIEPWIPTPVLELDAGQSRVLDVQIAGYVSLPMGRIKITNPSRDPIKINGGVVASTYDVSGWMLTDPPETAPIGFKNDIVLQRKVRITSRAGNATSAAVVEVNEDGAGYAVNSWVIQ